MSTGENQPSTQNLGRRLTRLYILALSIVAVLSITAQGLIQWSLIEQSNDSRVINIAGRQRMLSQRLTKASLAVRFADSEASQAQSLQELADVVQLWERSHLGLQQGDAGLGLPGDNSPTVEAMFAEIEPHYQAMLLAAEAILELERPIADAAISPWVETILANEANFLVGMDGIVFQYDSEARDRVSRLRVIELTLLLITITTLALEARYIFRPAVQTINRAFEALQAATVKRQQAEQDLEILQIVQRSRQQMAAVIDATPDWLYAKDKTGRYIMVNQSFAKTMDLHPKDVVGKTEAELRLDLTETAPPSTEEPLLSEVVHVPNRTVTLDDGSQRTHDLYKIPLFDETGEPYATLTISRDVTERVEAEMELEEYRYDLEKMVVDRTQRLEFVNTVSEQLNATLDLEKLLHDLVRFLQDHFNYYFVQVYLFDPQMSALVLRAKAGRVGHTHHDYTARGEGIVQLVAQTGQSILVNDVAQSADFVPHPKLPHTKAELAVPFNTGTIIVGVLDIQSDEVNSFTKDDEAMLQAIADQTAVAVNNAQLLAERQQTIQRLRNLDQAKFQFITMMSHELRTPLNAINGFAELLLYGISGELPEQAQQDARHIYNNGQHLLSLINEILDISQIETGRIQLKRDTIFLAKIVEQVVEQITPLVDEKPITLVTEVPNTLPPLYADPMRLKQILLNLLNNAIKFTKKGRVTIYAHQQGDSLYCAVRDTGIGIPPDKQALIFEDFLQIDMTDAREYGGTGLGLSICKRLVSLHDGEIGVISEEGVGSEFWVTLPIATAKNQPDEVESFLTDEKENDQ